MGFVGFWFLTQMVPTGLSCWGWVTAPRLLSRVTFFVLLCHFDFFLRQSPVAWVVLCVSQHWDDNYEIPWLLSKSFAFIHSCYVCAHVCRGMRVDQRTASKNQFFLFIVQIPGIRFRLSGLAADSLTAVAAGMLLRTPAPS